MGSIKESFFISHGSPRLWVDEGHEAMQFLKSWKDKVYPHTPNSILLISAHWETQTPTVNVVDTNDTIYDFYGFPDPLYQLKYAAPGAPNVAKRVKELLLASGHKRVDEDKKRGLDHGAWMPLMLMYPEAQIPVCQLSIQTDMDGTYHYNLGKALAPLKDEGVLIIGSGSATHNLQPIRFSDGSPPSWAVTFDTWLQQALLQGRYEDVKKYEERAPHAKTAHPRPDHFYPLHVAMGAAGNHSKAELIHCSWVLGSLSYTTYRFNAQ